MSFLDVLNQYFTLYGLGLTLLGVSIGILGGALPGISNNMTIALVAMTTYTMEPFWAITFMAAAQVGSNYGGSISATVLNVPGTPAAAATALEGYPLTRKGEATKALGVNVISSFMGNNIGVVLLIVTIPIMSSLAMKFGPWELFWFAVFGVVICANLSRENFLKGLLAAVLGLLLGAVGMDQLYGTLRFSFGSTYLVDGIAFIPAMVGLYGMSEVFTSLTDYNFEKVKLNPSESLFEFKEWWRYKWIGLRAAVLGFIIGAIPGVGPNIASWVGYDQARSMSKEPEKFGKGAIEGLIGSETGNNACVPGTYAPLLTLGVPGDGATAIALGVLLLHGIQPGPTFHTHNPQWLWQISIALVFSSILFLIIGAFIVKHVVKILIIPMPAIMAGVALLCVIGSYGVSSRIQDVYLMFIFGVLGLLMKKYGFSIAPLVLGLIVSDGLADANFRRGIAAGKGSFLPFFMRPISSVLIVIIAFIIIKEFIYPYIKKRKFGMRK